MIVKRRLIIVFTLILILLASVSVPAWAQATLPTATPAQATTSANDKRVLVIAAVSAIQKPGLLELLANTFERQTGVPVQAKSYGTTDVLKQGETGNADILILNSRRREEQFITNGHGARRINLLYTDYVIVGPAQDPANIQTSVTAIDALTKIYRKQAPFISRGDSLSTQNRENTIWRLAEIQPSGSWYTSAKITEDGLALAEKQQAYTMADRTSFLEYAQATSSSLKILLEGDIKLFTYFGAVSVKAKESVQVNSEQAEQFLNWLTLPETQKLITEFGKDKFGQTTFFPAQN
jgi:tungstate transport system substrate-binding protein